VIDGEFQVSGRVGGGSHADVYLARQLSLGGRPVAVKVLSRLYLTGSARERPRAEETIRREATLLGALRSRCFVSVHRAGELPDGRPWFAMEYLQAPDLGEVFKSGLGFSIGEIHSIFTQLAMGLAELHGLGYVHRDLKPANISVERHAANLYTVKVFDFGTVTALTGTKDRTAQAFDPNSPMGTPAYMSPEQALGGFVDGRSDLFALASIVYQLMTGVHAVAPRRPGVQGVLDYLRGDDAIPSAPIRSYRTEVSPRLASVVERNLARDPDRRHAKAIDFVKSFDAALFASAGGGGLWSNFIRRFKRQD